MRMAQVCAVDAERVAALDVSEDVACQTIAGADAASLQTVQSPQIEARSCVLLVTALSITLLISNAQACAELSCSH